MTPPITIMLGYTVWNLYVKKGNKTMKKQCNKKFIDWDNLNSLELKYSKKLMESMLYLSLSNDNSMAEDIKDSIKNDILEFKIDDKLKYDILDRVSENKNMNHTKKLFYNVCFDILFCLEN